MRAMTWVTAALVLAFATACNDRERDDTANIDNAAEEAGAEIREGAEDVGDAAENAAEETGEAVDEATDDLGDASFERRDEFRNEVQERLDALNRELAEAEKGINDDAADARVEAVGAAREARDALKRSLDRIGNATRDNWASLKDEIDDALNAAELRVRELRPDANPMGGTS